MKEEHILIQIYLKRRKKLFAEPAKLSRYFCFVIFIVYFDCIVK